MADDQKHSASTAKTSLRQEDDIERASGSTAILPVDPFQFRDGIVSEEQLTNVRRRKGGKHVANYQRRQNDVFANASLLTHPLKITSAHCVLAKTHG